MRAHSKFSVVELIADHYKTLRNHDTGKSRIGDLVVYLGLPLAAAAGTALTCAQARNLPEVLAATAILTGLIFNVFVLMFDLTMRAAEKSDPARLRDIMRLAGELRANISYAVLIGIVLTASLGGFVMFADSDQLGTMPTAVIVFGGVQLLLTIFMILKRVRALYRAYMQVQPDRVP